MNTPAAQSQGVSVQVRGLRKSLDYNVWVALGGYRDGKNVEFD